MTDDMLHVMEWHNGDKDGSPFSPAEMTRRLTALRAWMARSDVDAVLLTTAQGIAYFSGWLQGAAGWRCGMVVTQDAATTIAGAVEGGRPWRRGFGGHISYTDWRRDNFFRAVRQLTPGVRRLGLESDQTTMGSQARIESALPGVEIVDASPAIQQAQRLKSAEELDLIRAAGRIADVGAAAVTDAMAETCAPSGGLAEHDIALVGTRAMQHAIAAAFPQAELAQTVTRVQSGINTDGALNPATSRVPRRGDILSFTCCPGLFGYGVALGRTAFAGPPDAASLAVWTRNLAVHRRGLALIRPGARCSDIAAELNALYREAGLLQRRSAGFGRALGLLVPQDGQDAAFDLREDAGGVLEAGMVLTLEPMVMIPEGQPGAGGYREQDTVIVTPTGAEVVTRFPLGPGQTNLSA